jgi:hypothetical protein
MDSTALQLIAEVRGTTAALAEAEQRVASVTADCPAGSGRQTGHQTPTHEELEKGSFD